RRHTRSKRDWSSDVCSSDLLRVPDLWRTSRSGTNLYGCLHRSLRPRRVEGTRRESLAAPDRARTGDRSGVSGMDAPPCTELRRGRMGAQPRSTERRGSDRRRDCRRQRTGGSRCPRPDAGAPDVGDDRARPTPESFRLHHCPTPTPGARQCPLKLTPSRGARTTSWTVSWHSVPCFEQGCRSRSTLVRSSMSPPVPEPSCHSSTAFRVLVDWA